MPSAQERKL